MSGTGSYIFLGRHELEMAERFFQEFGAVAVLIGRLLPVIRTFIALPAGVAKMPRLRFHVYLYRFVAVVLCAGLDWHETGRAWDKDPRLKQWFHRLDAVIILLLLAGITGLYGHIGREEFARYRLAWNFAVYKQRFNTRR